MSASTGVADLRFDQGEREHEAAQRAPFFEGDDWRACLVCGRCSLDHDSNGECPPPRETD